LNYQKEKEVMLFNARFKMTAKIEGKLYESRVIPLRVKGAEVKKGAQPHEPLSDLGSQVAGHGWNPGSGFPDWWWQGRW
jgi:hypothetical protein